MTAGLLERTAGHRIMVLCIGVVVAAAPAACGAPEPPVGYRSWTTSYLIRASSDPMPPFARERTRFKIVVIDKKSNEPIEGGEGRIFAESRDGAKTWDGLTPAPEVGTYYGTLSFITAGDWAVAIQFRRDSTAPLERIDWMQQVRAERDTTRP